jgi:UDP-perosamine 4-acetyltransferase
MDKVYRKGVNLSVVFMSTHHKANKDPELYHLNNQDNSIKKKLRRIAKTIYYTMIPPFMKPFAFRVYKQVTMHMSAALIRVNILRKNDNIIVIGAGGHAKVCIELLQSMGETVAYCIGADDSADVCMGTPVYKDETELVRLRREGYYKAFIAIGDNKLRYALAEKVLKLGYQLVPAISPQAIISQSATLGVGVAVMAGAVINAHATIENLAIINTGATIDHDCKIGTAAHIAPQCGLAGNVIVGASSFLGIGTSVIPGVSIGEKVIVGAGSVVVANVPDGHKVAGVPAKPMTVKMIKEIG